MVCLQEFDDIFSRELRVGVKLLLLHNGAELLGQSTILLLDIDVEILDRLVLFRHHRIEVVALCDECVGEDKDESVEEEIEGRAYRASQFLVGHARHDDDEDDDDCPACTERIYLLVEVQVMFAEHKHERYDAEQGDKALKDGDKLTGVIRSKR